MKFCNLIFNSACNTNKIEEILNCSIMQISPGTGNIGSNRNITQFFSLSCAAFQMNGTGVACLVYGSACRNVRNVLIMVRTSSYV
jgi:hypothetical protein